MELEMLAFVSGVQRSLDGYVQPQPQSLSGPLPFHVGASAGTEATSPVLRGYREPEGWREDSSLKSGRGN